MSHNGASHDGCKNTDRTEVIWFGSRASLNKLLYTAKSTISRSAERSSSLPLPSETWVSNSTPSCAPKQRLRKVVATCFFHLRRLRQIRRRVGQELTLHLVLAYVITRLDYCNSLLACLPLLSLEPLQRVQNGWPALMALAFRQPSMIFLLCVLLFVESVYGK